VSVVNKKTPTIIMRGEKISVRWVARKREVVLSVRDTISPVAECTEYQIFFLGQLKNWPKKETIHRAKAIQRLRLERDSWCVWAVRTGHRNTDIRSPEPPNFIGVIENPEMRPMLYMDVEVLEQARRINNRRFPPN
jgi:hypothetical protein